MPKILFRLASVAGGLALSLSARSAPAQWFPAGDPCNQCAVSTAAIAPVQTVACAPVHVQAVQCQCAVPVARTTYQTVPVTEYHEVKQTVQKPVYETAYVDQQVTEYRPVTEVRTAQVPITTYEDVTEFQTVTRDQGFWQTSYACVPKVSACAYDPRPGFLGWLNRTSYSMRSAMTPSVVSQRQWVPNVVTTQVPVTRRVARQGVREVAYNVTRMEPYTTTRKVAVNKVRYETQVVSKHVPVTTYRSVPTGTALAWVPGGSATALALPGTTTATLTPTPDPAATARATETTIAPRSANATNDKFLRNGREDRFSSPAPGNEPFTRDPVPDASRGAGNVTPGVNRSSYEVPQSQPPQLLPTTSDSQPSRTEDGFRPTKFRAATAPSMVRFSRPAVAQPENELGPELSAPAVAAADMAR